MAKLLQRLLTRHAKALADKVVTALFEKNKEQGIDETVNRQSSNRKFVEDGSLFIALPDGRIYNANGLRVK